MMNSVTRPSAPTAALATGLVLALSLAACTGEDAPPPDPVGPTVTVDHPMGRTEVPLHPETVVSLSPVWDDAFAALGDPVDVSFRTADPLVPAPWEDPAPGDLGYLPAWSNPAADILDEIRDADPDLILGGGVRSPDLYEELSETAPTIVDEVAPDSPGDNPDSTGYWAEVTRQAGQILDREQEAEELVAALGRRIGELSQRHPGIVGATVGVLPQGAGGDSGGVSEQAERTVASLGLTLVTGDAAQDADIVLDPGNGDAAVVRAMHNPTVLSLPWLMQQWESVFTELDEQV